MAVPLPPPAAQPGLPGAFMAHLAANPPVLRSIRDFQLVHRGRFLGTRPGEEYTIEQTASHQSFMALVDQHLTAYLAKVGTSDADFAEAMLEMKRGQDPHWQAFDLLLRRVDFEGFASLMRSNVCLCCGGQFAFAPPAPAPHLAGNGFGAAGAEAGVGLGDIGMQVEPPAPATVEVEVTVPPGINEGQPLAVDFAGLRYQVPVPAGCPAGSVIRVALQVPRAVLQT